MRIDGDRLDSADAYNSPSLGDQKEEPRADVSSRGKIPVGPQGARWQRTRWTEADRGKVREARRVTAQPFCRQQDNALGTDVLPRSRQPKMGSPHRAAREPLIASSPSARGWRWTGFSRIPRGAGKIAARLSRMSRSAQVRIVWGL